MYFLLHLLLAAQLITCKQAPVGTQLHIRLITAVGSYASKPGTSVHGILIAPVVVDGETVLPAGTLVTGALSSVKKVGYGFVHETAALGLDFTRLTLPGGAALSMSSRVTNVENGRERVSKDGIIHGIRSTSSLCYRTSGYIRTALGWEFHAALATWFIKALVVQVPEPEIYYPAGVELTLALKQPLFFDPHSDSDDSPPRMARGERVNLRPVVEELPSRAYALSRPSDVINVLFIGSRQQISNAFVAAGWAQANAPSLRSGITNIRAVAEERGDLSAPMSSMQVNNAEPDMSWEKGFNDASKRDHIRMWRQPGTWDGRDLWVAAATRDIDFAYFRHGQRMTHRIERDVDQERDKVTGDLTFTACVDAVDSLDRSSVPRAARNATGDFMTTDGRLAVLRMNDCVSPRSTPTEEEPALPLHGNKIQRFARREVLSFRNDLMRENIYYRAYEGTRWLIEAAIRRHRRHLTEPEYTPAPPVLLERAQNMSGHAAGSP